MTWLSTSPRKVPLKPICGEEAQEGDAEHDMRDHQRRHEKRRSSPRGRGSDSARCASAAGTASAIAIVEESAASQSESRNARMNSG